jgi:hypothetical protein
VVHQRGRLHHVLVVVAHRLLDRVGHDDERRAVDRRADVRMVAKHPIHQRSVTDVAPVANAAGHTVAAGVQVVQHDGRDAGVIARQRDGVADVAGAAG